MEELADITPVNFFELAILCRRLPEKGVFPQLSDKNISHYLLPETSMLCNEQHFANVAMGWSKQGIELLFDIGKPFEEACYPDVYRGDSIEVFIDTRDVKSSGFNTRFCHHFYFLPEPVEGRQAGEVTHFRTEDAHDLCASSDLRIKTILNKTKYTVHCWIPAKCLIGFEPDQFDRMGFAYRINRPHWESQHFSVVTEDYKLEQQPSLWSHMRMVK